MSDAKVRAACEAAWNQFSDDCSGFVKEVGKQLGVAIAGNANEIADSLSAGGGWTLLPDGRAAEAAARAGKLVVAGLRGDKQATKSTNGHVVVVVGGALARDKYPPAYWGQLHGVGQKDMTTNYAWVAADRDRVVYAARDIMA